MTREEILAELRALPTQRRNELLCAMGHELLPVWERYAAEQGSISYYESVVGTHQVVDLALPRRALREVDALLAGQLVEMLATDWDFAEPKSALQSDDIDFGEAMLAWYAIFNLHHFVRNQLGYGDRDETILLQFANELELDDAALTAWWLRARETWTVEAPAAVSPVVFDALVRCDFAAVLDELPGGLVRAVVLLLAGREEDAVTMATRTIGYAGTDLAWFAKYLGDIAPHAIVVDSKRNTFGFHDGARVAWVERESKVVRVLERMDDARPRCLHADYEGAALWVGYEYADRTQALCYPASGLRTAKSYPGARSILAVGPHGQLACSDGTVMGLGFDSRPQPPTPIMGATFSRPHGRDAATHDGVTVALFNDTMARELAPPSPPVWIGMVGSCAVVACRDRVGATYILAEHLPGDED